MKFCTKCGKAIDDKYSVCPYCGEKLDASDAQDDAGATQYGGNNYNQPNNPYGQQNYQGYGQGAPAGNYATPNGTAPEYTPAPRPQRSAYVAAFLALLFGVYGLHDFYLDRKNKGLLKLLLTLLGCGIGVFVSLILSIIDAIKLLKGEINTDGKGEMIKMGL